MLAIIALVVAAIVALTVLGFALHILFSPWLLVVIAIVAWIKIPAEPLPPVTGSVSSPRHGPALTREQASDPRAVHLDRGATPGRRHGD